MLEACRHLPGPQKKFDPFISLLKRDFDISIDQPFPWNQLCHNHWRWSFIVIGNCFFRSPFRDRSFLGYPSVAHAIYSLVPTFLGFGQCSVDTFRRVICIPTLVSRFGRFESFLALQSFRAARITYVIIFVIKWSIKIEAPSD
ncbi:hypothetical protein ACFX2K_044176 [Malus domestica]